MSVPYGCISADSLLGNSTSSAGPRLAQDSMAVPGVNALSMTLWGHLGHGLFAIRPFNIAIERDPEGLWVVSDDIFLVYGMGSAIHQAYDEYVASLAEYCDLVFGGAASNLYDQSELGRLNRYLQRDEAIYAQ